MKKVLVVLMALALVVFFGTQAVYAHSNLIPAVKVGGGWVSVVSYVNTQAPASGAVFVHATYQMKNPANLLDRCLHLDGRSATTLNDLTTTILTVTGGGLGTVFPAGDTIGGAIISPATIGAVSEGFLVLENYDGTGALGADGTLTSEAIIFNLASGFLYSQRGLTTTHLAASPAGNVWFEAPACGNCNDIDATPRSAGVTTAFSNDTGGTLTRFMFLPPATATSGAYVIALNDIGTAEASDNAASLNLVSADYNARIGLEARMDLAQAYALGVYNRLENFRSITQTNDIVCLAQLTPAQLVGGDIPLFIADGGWANLAPRCRESEAGVVQLCNGNGIGVEFGDAAMIYKVEFASGYGFAITPMNQQWYAK